MTDVRAAMITFMRYATEVRSSRRRARKPYASEHL